MPKEQPVFLFKNSLPGLPEDLKEFRLTALQEDSPFFILQSLQDDTICFILVNPFLFFPDYEFQLSLEQQQRLEVNDAGQLAVFCIINTSGGLKEATANLLAPVIINTSNFLGRQIVLNDSGYSIRHPLPIAQESGVE